MGSCAGQPKPNKSQPNNQPSTAVPPQSTPNTINLPPVTNPSQIA